MRRLRAEVSCDGSDTECVAGPTELGCNQDGPEDTTSLLTLEASGALYVFVDGLGSQSGAYQLSAQGQYPLNGPCDPTGPAFITCPEGASCLEVDDPEAESPSWTCRLP